MKTPTKLDGDALQSFDSFKSVEKALIDLIAETAIWVKPTKVSQTPVYPHIRRGAPKEKGQIINGIRIDDNTYANVALKKAISKSTNFENYTVCHIWPGTTYDERYHTLLSNLVLIPRILAGLSDFCSSVVDVLKYRSWELYGWHPEGESVPNLPAYYPKKWRAFIEDDSKVPNEEIISLEEYLDNENLEKDIETVEYEQNKEFCEIEKVQRKVPNWFNKPEQICSRILILFLKMSENGSKPISKKDFKEKFENLYSDPFDSNYNQMKNFGVKNHAKVFSEDALGDVRLWAPVNVFIKKCYESYLKKIHK